MKRFLGALLVGGLLLSAACRPALDTKVANYLLAVVSGEQPTIHGSELTRLSVELPRYQPLIIEAAALAHDYHLREGLAWIYTQWCYDDDAIVLLREELKSGQLTLSGGQYLALQAAYARDVSTLEKVWKSTANDGAVLGNIALEQLARGQVADGLTQALNDLNRQTDNRVRSNYRALLARVMAQDAPNPKPGSLEARIFNVQLAELLRGGDWSDFVRGFSDDQHDFLHTILVEDLVFTMGSAAEYYAKLGNEPQKAEWLQRLADVSGAYRKKNHLRKAAWVDYLIARVKSAPARPPAGRRP